MTQPNRKNFGQKFKQKMKNLDPFQVAACVVGGLYGKEWGEEVAPAGFSGILGALGFLFGVIVTNQLFKALGLGVLWDFINHPGDVATAATKCFMTAGENCPTVGMLLLGFAAWSVYRNKTKNAKDAPEENPGDREPSEKRSEERARREDIERARREARERASREDSDSNFEDEIEGKIGGAVGAFEEVGTLDI